MDKNRDLNRVRPMSSVQSHLPLAPTVRRLRPYRCTRADVRARRAVKEERGSVCELCEVALALEQLSVHHILETRIYPEFAREPLNMLVLCGRCHSSVTRCEHFAGSTAIHFYSTLSATVRRRHLPFLEITVPASAALISAFRSGNSMYWSDLVVRDLTR